ncbi:hypothetical protein [Streptomyces sp. NPDC048489]|uniref:hypothetical protein n=1 Tax=Streptomyces sp. NPDC048489 TaxID=3154504 RepID=UPI00344306D3
MSDTHTHMAFGIMPDLTVVLEWTPGEEGVRLSVADTGERFEDLAMAAPDVEGGFADDDALTEIVGKLVSPRGVRSWESLEVFLSVAGDRIVWYGPADMPSSVRAEFEKATA